MTIHHWFYRSIPRQERQWAVWVCMAGNCFRQSPLICIFCYQVMDEDLHVCSMLYSANHLHRSEGVDTYANIRCVWRILKETLLYTDENDTTPRFFFAGGDEPYSQMRLVGTPFPS